jgi:hypothetical protein
LSPGVTPVSNIVFPSLKWSNVTVVHTDIYPNTTIITQHKYFNEPNIIFADIVMDITTRNSERKDAE